MTVKSLRKQLAAAIAMTLVATVALGSSTYAWFVQNTIVKAESITVTAETVSTLLISKANQNAYGTLYSLEQPDSTTFKFKPVSTTGAGNLSGTTISFFKDTGWKADAATGKISQYNASKFSAAEANVDYYTDSFDIKSSKVCDLYLDSNSLFTATAGNMNKTLRLALVVKGTGNTNTDGVYIYQIDPTTGTAEDGAYYNTTLNALSADGIVKAIKAATTGDAAVAADADKIAGKNVDATSGVNKYLASATATNNALATAPTSDTVGIETVNAADKLYTFSAANDVVNITMYLWMEGCDYDCNANTIYEITGTDNQVTANLEFAAKFE